jgi:hypothetical protein
MRDNFETFDLFEEIVKILAKKLDNPDLSSLYTEITEFKVYFLFFKNDFNTDKVLSLNKSYKNCKELSF